MVLVERMTSPERQGDVTQSLITNGLPSPSDDLHSSARQRRREREVRNEGGRMTKKKRSSCTLALHDLMEVSQAAAAITKIGSGCDSHYNTVPLQSFSVTHTWPAPTCVLFLRCILQ